MKISIDTKKAVFLLIFTLACLSIATAILHNGWFQTWSALHIPTLSPMFADMRTVQGSIQSDQLGLNPQVKNPGDPWSRTLDYPILWLWIAKLLQLDHETNFVLFVCVYLLAYIAACFFLLRNSPSPYLLLTAFSWTSLLAVERGNNDLLTFALLFAAITLSQSYFRAFLILLLTVLKVYPALLVVTLAKKPKILIALTLIIAGYFLFNFSQLKIIQAGNTALSDPASIYASYGFDTIMRNIQPILWGLSPTAYTVLKYGLILVSFLLIAKLSQAKSFHPAETSAYKTDLFISGGIIFSGTFLITSNWDYRLIFLLFCIPYILFIQNQFVKHSMLISILLSSNIGFLWANPSSFSSLLCAMIKYYVFLMVSACLLKEMMNYLPVAFFDRLKQANIPVISSIHLNPVSATTLERTVGKNRPFYLKPHSWLRIVALLAVLLYFYHTAQEYFIPRLVPHYGTLNLHITGLRPPGHVIIRLKADYSQNLWRNVYMSFDSTELTYSVDALYFGNYAIQVIHDENNNHTADMDSDTGLFSEGFGMVNLGKLDLRNATAVKEGIDSGLLKYTFDRREKTVEIKMYYPPFPWQNK